MRMMCCFRLWVGALLALMVGFHAQATIFTWDGGAGTDNWKDGNNWNPDGTVVVTNTTGAHRLNVNGAQISGGSFSTSGSTAPDVLGNGAGSTALLLIDGGTRVSFF